MRNEKCAYFAVGIIVGYMLVSMHLYMRFSYESGLQTAPAVTTNARDVLIPYEDNDRSRLRAKEKYFERSNSIFRETAKRQKLQPVVLGKSEEDELGLVRNVQDLKFRDEGYRLHGFNALVSRNLDYRRPVPDTRHRLCKNTTFPSDLPSASVVICFYNEQFDTLVRSLHSILDRTPDALLKEIILVDDFSDLDRLHETVQLYIDANLKKVKLFRTPVREGLIRARIFGADQAQGEVLVFLDSHVEVNRHWLEPLLARIAQSPTIVVTPIIDIVDADTFEYTASPLVRGGFNWGLHFKWVHVPNALLKTDEDFIRPITSPTMAGGLFAISRGYFVDMGKYDAGMNIWGGENLEMSFRIWQCGGSIEIIPCSRVGHVFRKRRPYGSPDGEDTMLRNSLRVANVWMDEYKENYYKMSPGAREVNFGDISSRVELRQKLQCKPFSWYLKHVYPELSLPSDSKQEAQAKANAVFQPRRPVNRNFTGDYLIRLSNTNLCVASEKDVKTKGSRLVLRTCLRVKSQIWWETNRGELKLAQYLCLDAEDSSSPRLAKCHEMGGPQEWKHRRSNRAPLYNLAAGTCLTASERVANQPVVMDICANHDRSQWDFVPVAL